MVAGVLAWLWPIGLGGRMPVGGDATQFSMGLMAFLGDSLRAGRLPLWNDLWGFGFPGLAESQMGVYYPPHLLYGALTTEAAYTTLLVIHTVWGALGTAWAARRFGVSEGGAALAGFAWATCGSALIHLPHQWAYTVGSWMPWAWGLAWQVARGEGGRRSPWLLAAVLAVQTLPGHFQLAFITEVGALVLALASGRRAARGTVAVGLAVAGMVPLASPQLWPTFELARLSDSARGFTYLSGFAATPLHLVSYLAPGLFHRSPLWRPLAWDVFHTSPEEHLGSVGLVPLFLAMAAIGRGWRGDGATRALVVAAGVTVILSCGPYAPGFDWLIRVPGFSFFRAPARWGLATSLALAILAGKGFDGLGLDGGWPRAGRWLAGFAMAAALGIGVVVGGFELALASSRGAGWPAVEAGFGRAIRALPWSDRAGGAPGFRAVMAEAYRPQADLRVMTAQARIDGKPPKPPGPTLAAARPGLYARELGETGLVLVALLVVAGLGAKRRAFAAALVAVAAGESLTLARHRPFDLGPARPLVAQSPVLARLVGGPRGLRTLDPGQNLFLVAGVDPVSAYRTLDLPAPGALLAVAKGPAADPRAAEALRAAGVGLRVLDPFESRGRDGLIPPGWALDQPGPIRDPALAGWLFGVDLASALDLGDFAPIRPIIEPTQAWLISSTPPESPRAMGDPAALLSTFRAASPLRCRSEAPERAEVEVRVAYPGPSTVVLSRTFDPEWRGEWTGPEGESKPARVVRVLGGWQGVEVPGPGRWTLRLEYEGRAARHGLALASIAWTVWGIAFFWRSRRTRDSGLEDSGLGTREKS